MKTNHIETEALGFPLDVTINVGEFEKLGEHRTFENHETKQVDAGIPHTINVQSGLDVAQASMVAAHEAYHMFESIRHLITCDEETAAETFGGLVREITLTAL
jgi:hypothetical protein